jgi:hypothetical protein
MRHRSIKVLGSENAAGETKMRSLYRYKNTNTTDCISLFLPHPSEMSKLDELEKDLPDCLFTPKHVIAAIMRSRADKET